MFHLYLLTELVLSYVGSGNLVRQNNEKILFQIRLFSSECSLYKVYSLIYNEMHEITFQ